MNEKILSTDPNDEFGKAAKDWIEAPTYSELKAAMQTFIDDVESSGPKDTDYLASTAWGFMQQFKKLLGAK